MKARFFVLINGETKLRCGGVSRIIPASEDWILELSIPLNFVELQAEIDERAERKGIFNTELRMLQRLGTINVKGE